MAATEDRCSIVMTVQRQYVTVASVTVSVPANADATFVGRILERKFADLQSTVEEIKSLTPVTEDATITT